MTVYKLKLFTKRADADGQLKEYCLKKNIMAIGFYFDDCTAVKTIQDYYNKAIKEYKKGSKKSSFETCFDYINNIKENDYIWTQKNGISYYLGKIPLTSTVRVNKTTQETIDNNDYKNLNWLGLIRECNWKKIAFDDVPGQVISGFVGTSITLNKMNTNDDFNQYCAWLYNDQNTEESPQINDIKSLLHSDDLEDLLGLYLQKEKNYYIIPSTNKTSTKLIEYELRGKNDEKACVQCKIGKEVVNDNMIQEIRKNFDKGEKDKYNIYISTIANSQIKENDNTKFISVETLIKFAKDNQTIIPTRIQNYLSFMK